MKNHFWHFQLITPAHCTCSVSECILVAHANNQPLSLELGWQNWLLVEAHVNEDICGLITFHVIENRCLSLFQNGTLLPKLSLRCGRITVLSSTLLLLGLARYHTIQDHFGCPLTDRHSEGQENSACRSCLWPSRFEIFREPSNRAHLCPHIGIDSILSVHKIHPRQFASWPANISTHKGSLHSVSCASV